MHAQSESLVETLSERVRSERPRIFVAPDNRRRDRRFSVSGTELHVPTKSSPVRAAAVEVRDLLFGVVPSLWMQRREVLDLSKGGLAFESRWPVVRGRKLRLQLWVPGYEKPFELSGETRWCKRLLGRCYRVGVQFDAFGAAPGMNSQHAFDALRALEEQTERTEAPGLLEDQTEAQPAAPGKTA